MTTNSILLKNGTLLIHSHDGHVINPIVSDLFIRSNLIERIAQEIPAEEDTVVIDCTGKIISPGFIDTHRHMWHTQTKGSADSTLFDYLIAVNFIAGPLYSPNDVFWGQLAGCLEALDAGTTTVVDHSHINHAEENVLSAVSATLTSGIRSIYCYCPNARVATWSPEYTLDTNPPSWFAEQLERLASLPEIVGHRRVTTGLAFDGISTPREAVEAIIGKARKLNLGLITTHHAAPLPSIKVLSDYNLLSKDMLFSHANAITVEEISLLSSKGGFITSTPSTELQMGMGSPVCSKPELRAISSLGVDCHSTTSADLFGQMRLLLQSARNSYTKEIGHMPAKTNITAQEVFNMGTIGGARAIGMEDLLGSIKEGKLADIVIFDGTSPAMVCGNPKDPIGAIVLHASTRDVHTVIVDGKIRKSKGILSPSQLETLSGVQDEKIEWEKVAREVIESRTRIEEGIKGIDASIVRLAVMKMFGL